MPIKEAVHNLTQSFLQRGDPMRQRGYGASPSATKDITASSSTEGKQVCRDSVRQPFVPETLGNGTGAVHTGNHQPTAYRLQQSPWSTLSTMCL
jgi:hypothetical protein